MLQVGDKSEAPSCSYRGGARLHREQELIVATFKVRIPSDWKVPDTAAPCRYQIGYQLQYSTTGPHNKQYCTVVHGCA